MNVNTEDFKNFINDEKYKEVREYLLASFKRINMLSDFIINNPKSPYSNYEKNPWLNDTIEDICESAVSCIELLERAYHD